MATALGPRSVERSGDIGWTLAGTLDGAEPARVDGAGLVNPAGAAWSIDWWIGGDDRWYFPSREHTVRQRRLGPGPVIETTVRIPSGDARQVVYGAMVDGREMTVVEVHNESPVPVALALSVRPYDVLGRSCGVPLTIDAVPRAISVDSRPALLLPRPANETGGASSIDLVEAVSTGAELHWEDGAGRCQGPRANAVVLYPLPHRTSLRFLVPNASGAVTAPAVDPVSAPAADAVARGWGSLVDAAGRVELADPGLTAMVGGARARLMLGAGSLRSRLASLEPGAGLMLHGLALYGHRSELGEPLDTLAATFPTRLDNGARAAADVVAALGPALWATATGPRPELIEVAAQVTHLIERTGEPGPTSKARQGLAELVRLSGDERGAAHLGGSQPAADPIDLAQVMALGEQASAAGSWLAPPEAGDDPVSAARFLLAARSLLVDDSGDDLVLLPRFPTAWRGGNVEVHRLATKQGELSFGIRWHGARPALLWQRDGPPAVLRCPGLDPAWSATEARGETLLAGSAEGLVETPGPGDSFT